MGTDLEVHAGLLQAVTDDPLDGTAWLVLADWLEDHNDPRAGRCRFLLKARETAAGLPLTSRGDYDDVENGEIYRELKRHKSLACLWPALCCRYLPCGGMPDRPVVRFPAAVRIAEPLVAELIGLQERRFCGLVDAATLQRRRRAASSRKAAYRLEMRNLLADHVPGGLDRLNYVITRATFTVLVAVDSHFNRPDRGVSALVEAAASVLPGRDVVPVTYAWCYDLAARLLTLHRETPCV